MGDRELAVEVEYVFDRLGDAGLPQAYRILVPEQRRATQQGADHGDGSDLRTGVLDPGRCGGCDVTHVLLPASMLAFRGDFTELIRRASELKAAPLGQRPIQGSRRSASLHRGASARRTGHGRTVARPSFSEHPGLVSHDRRPPLWSTG